MAVTDQIKIPVTYELPPSALQGLKDLLVKEIDRMFKTAQATGQVIKPTLTAEPFETQLPSGQKVRISQKITSKLSSAQIANLEALIASGEIKDPRKADLEQYLKHIVEVQDLPAKAIEPMKEQLEKLASLKRLLKFKPVEQHLALITKFGKEITAFPGELAAMKFRAEQRLSSQAYSKLRAKLGSMSPEEQYAEIMGTLAEGRQSVFSPLQLDKLRATATKLKATIGRTKSAGARERFGNYLERVKGIEDFAKQEELLDRFLAQRDQMIKAGRAEDVRQAQILRTNVERRRKQQETFSRKQQFAQRANTVLMGSSLFLGAFGSAGFPALNVGFAAISASSIGMPIIGAAIAGTVTAIGELSRKIMELRDSAVQTAQGIGFVSERFKLMEARQKGIESVIGGVAMASDVAASDIQRRMGLSGPSFFGIGMSKGWNDFTNALNTQWKSITGKWQGNIPTGYLESLLPTTFFRMWREQAAASQLQIPIELRSARQQLVQQLNKPTVGIENDPLAIWKRIQQAAFDPTKAEERKIYRELIAKIDEWIKKVDDAMKEDKSSNPGKNVHPWGWSGAW